MASRRPWGALRNRRHTSASASPESRQKSGRPAKCQTSVPARTITSQHSIAMVTESDHALHHRHPPLATSMAAINQGQRRLTEPGSGETESGRSVQACCRMFARRSSRDRRGRRGILSQGCWILRSVKAIASRKGRRSQRRITGGASPVALADRGEKPHSNASTRVGTPAVGGGFAACDSGSRTEDFA